MKKHIFLFALIGVLFFIKGCKEDTKEPLFNDSISPGPVTDVEITSLPGGAEISYSLPTDGDLAYVKAEYTLSDGQEVNTKSSNYLNNLTIQGFGDTKEKQVTLYAVDRSENVSPPVTVKITPETPNVHQVQSSMEMIPNFGGVLYRWKNENNAPLSFMLLAEDSLGVLVEKDLHYSGVTEGEFALRGFDPKETEFGIVIRDRWDNFSDSTKAIITPLFEEVIDKSKFTQVWLANENEWNGWDGEFDLMFDDNIHTFGHTKPGDGWPHYLTIDMGVEARLSRVVVHQRQDASFVYRHGNPRFMDIWGCKEEPAQDGSWDNWYPLRVAEFGNGCVARRPSDEGGSAAEDQVHLANGDDYSFALDDPEVRYIRFVIHETWGNTGFVCPSEITFYGQTKNEN
jgi:hypothetical protein